jgi:hypothetical protein
VRLAIFKHFEDSIISQEKKITQKDNKIINWEKRIFFFPAHSLPTGQTRPTQNSLPKLVDDRHAKVLPFSQKDKEYPLHTKTCGEELLVQRVRDHKAGKLKERRLPKKKSVEDHLEESKDTNSEKEEEEEEEDSSDR